MPTEIDNLQIKIVSNSSGAAASVRDLGAALKELKGSKATSKALDILEKISHHAAALRGTGSAGGELQKLASGLSALSGVGSLARLTNNIEKLAPALERLKTVNMGDSGEKLRNLATALEPLGNMNTRGFSGAVNSLSKLPDITSKLDDATISNFADKVQRISEILTPLSEKMTPIAEGFKNIGKEAKTSGEKVDFLQKALNAISFSSILRILKSGINIGKQIVDKFDTMTGDVIDFEGIIERFRRGFGQYAQEAHNWILRLNKDMGINTQTFMQYSSIFAQMMEGLGVSQRDASKMAVGYTELAYDIWAAYNDVFKGSEDAVQAVQSAIAGQTRPLRRAGLSVLNVTLEQTAANHGLAISIQNATEAEKSYLRYLALVDQARSQGIVGTYAREMKTAEGMLRTLKQQLRTLSQEAGNLFLPLITKAVPVIQAFVRIASGYIKKLAALFGVELITPDWGDSTGFTEAFEDGADSADAMESGLGGAAEKAKELKKTILGIDEINPLNSPTGGGGGGGGGGYNFADDGAGASWNVDSLWTEEILKGINEQVDGIATKMESILKTVEDLLPAVAAISFTAWASKLAESLTSLGGIGTALGVVATITAQGVVTWVLTNSVINADTEAEAMAGLFGEFVTAAISGATLTRLLGSENKGYAYGIAFGITAAVSVAQVGWVFGDSTSTVQQKQNAIAQGFVSVLEGAAAGAAIGFTVGGGVPGALIGASIGAVATLVIGAISYAISKKVVTDEEAEQNLRDHFGTVHLTDAEVEVEVQKLKAKAGLIQIDDDLVDVYTAASLVVQATIDQKTAETNINSGLAAIQLNLDKIKLGIDVSDQTMKDTVEPWLDSVASYIENGEKSMSISLAILGLSGSEDDQFNQEYWGGVKTKYESLRKELEKILNTETTESPLGLVGHELEVDFGVDFGMTKEQKAAAIADLTGKITDILNEVAQTEYEAKIIQLKLDASEAKLDYESWKQILDDIQEANQVLAGDMEVVERKRIQSLLLQGFSEEEAYEIAKQERSESMKNAYQVIFDSLDVLKTSYQEELDSTKAALEKSNANFLAQYGDTWNVDSWDEAIQQGLVTTTDWASNIVSYLQIDDETKAAIGKVLEDLAPTKEALEKVYNDYVAAGKAIPGYVTQGLNDINELEKLTGSVDAWNYDIGKKLTESDAFKDTLASVKDAFKDYDEQAKKGILANIGEVQTTAEGIVTVTKNGITTELGVVTPTLEENFAALGIDITGQLSKKSNKKQYKTDAKTIVDTVDGTVGAGGIGTGAGKFASQVKTDLGDKMLSKNFNFAGKRVLTGVNNGLNDKDAIDLVTGKVLKLGTKVIDTTDAQFTKKAFEPLGQKVPGGIGKGVESGNNTAFTKIADFAEDMKKTTGDKITKGFYSDIGQRVPKGVGGGIGDEAQGKAVAKTLGILADNVKTTIGDNLTKAGIATFGKRVPSGLGQGVEDKDAVKSVTGKLKTLAESMKTPIDTNIASSTFKTYAQRVPAGLTEGMEVTKDLKDAVTKVKNAIKPGSDSEWKGLGYNVVAGIVQGFSDAFDDKTMQSKIALASKKLPNKVEMIYQVGSPSKLFRDEIGVWLTAGIVEGMDQPYALVDPLKDMYGTAKDWWDDHSTEIVSDTSFGIEAEADHYMNLKDANNESNALLREQNELLRKLLEKETGSDYSLTGEEMLAAASHLNRRVGRTMISVEG